MDIRGKAVEVSISEEIAPPDVGPPSSGLQLLSNTVDLLDSSPEIEVQREQVDPVITFHNDSLRRTLVDVLHRARGGKGGQDIERERELEMEAKFARTIELERMISYYKAEAEWLQSRVDFMERENETLEKQLEGAKDEDPDPPVVVGRVRLGCKVCKTGLTTVMALPCRHACLCTGCDSPNIGFCLVCWAPRTSSVELRFLLD